MKICEKKLILVLLLAMVSAQLCGQQIIFRENFESVYPPFIPAIGSKASDSFEGTQNLSRRNATLSYTTPDIDFKKGIYFITFTYKLDKVADLFAVLNVHFSNKDNAESNLLATFSESTNGFATETLFLPASEVKGNITFEGSGFSTGLLLLDNIKVVYYKNATAFAQGNSVFVDTEFNFSSSFLKISVSKDQISALPTTTTLKTSGAPVLCPPGAILENEPDCYNDYFDTINSGCNNLPNRFTELKTCNGIVCGKSGNFYTTTIENRDVDSYKIVLNAGTIITMKVVADFNVKIYLISFPLDCDFGYITLPPTSGVTAAPGDTAIITYNSTSPRNIVFWVAPQGFNYPPTCGLNYVMIYKTLNSIITPATPVAAANPACNSTQLNPMTTVANYSFYWQGNSCNTSITSPANLAFPVTTSGNYYVNAKYNPLGCWTSCSSLNIQINQPSLINAYAFPLSVCAGSQAQLSANGAASYVWMPGNLSGAQVNVNPLTTTIYTVTGTSGACTASSTATISTNPYPAAAGNISGTSSLCEGTNAVSYNVGTITDATSYLWSYTGTGATINGTGNAVTIDIALGATSGTLTVKGNNACGYGSVSAAYPITVKPLPNVSASSSPSTVCAGSPSILTGLGNAASYTWQPGSLTGSPLNVSPSTTTIYTVTGNLNGCTSTSTVTVSTNPYPAAAGNISGTSSLCEGTNAVSYNVGTITDATSYLWSYTGTGATINGTGNTITIDFAPGATSGTLTVKGNNACGYGTVSSGYSITVKPLPLVSASGLPTIICNGQSSVLTANGNATSYTWQPGNLSGSPLIVSPSSTTVFTVTADLLGCTDTSSVVITVDPCTGISESSISDNIKVGPIPVHDQLMIQCMVNTDLMLSLFTVEGKLISVQELKGENTYFMPTTDLAAAIYFLRIRSENDIKTFKIVKE